MSFPRYIAIEGPIGAGKTSLAEALCKKLGARCIFEEPNGNPFLPEFYEEPEKYAFQTQISFLINRFLQQKALLQQNLFHKTTICDYLFAKDRIFAIINLKDHEYALYEKIYNIFYPDIPKPDFVVYLYAKAEILMERIKRRGRDYEKHISIEYLKKLTEEYNQFFYNYTDTPLLAIDTSEIDFVSSEGDLHGIIKAIEELKYGTKFYRPLGSG